MLRSVLRTRSLREGITNGYGLLLTIFSPPIYLIKSYSNVARGVRNMNFTNDFLKHLPVESEKRHFPRLVKGACFSPAIATPVDNPRLLVHSAPALALVDLEEDDIENGEFVKYVSGNLAVPGSHPVAHCYCGHQYGLFSGQLGDGAAIYLGAVTNTKDETWEVQLKGTGTTPYSRAGADGRKVLRSSIREFLASEAMFSLGIPTTRAATCVTTDTTTQRDIQFDGTKTTESVAVIMRMAQSFLRIGSLEVCLPQDDTTGKAGPSSGNVELLKHLLDYFIETQYPHINGKHSTDVYSAFFRELMSRTAHLVAQWQSVGFCHGVLNTDNMSLIGITMDYGPFAFMEVYDPHHICNGSDFWCRYSYTAQPDMCRWCLDKLAQAVQPLIDQEITQNILLDFDQQYESYFISIMRKKLGLQQELNEDKDLIDQLFDTMYKTGSDFTKTFRVISSLPLPATHGFHDHVDDVLRLLVGSCCTSEVFKNIFSERKDPESIEIERSMWILQTNPELLPNYVSSAKEATDELNRRPIIKYAQDLTKNSKRQNDEKLWKCWVDRFLVRLADEISRSDITTANERRKASMDAVNPRFVMKNYIVQDAISAAQCGNYKPVHLLLKMVQDPFSDMPGVNESTSEGEKMEIIKILAAHDRGVIPRLNLRIT